MKPSIALLALLGGCALGASSPGQRWVKAGEDDGALQSALIDCTQQMKQLTAVQDPVCPPFAVPGHTACLIGSDVASRKQFSRECMTGKGWSLQ